MHPYGFYCTERKLGDEILDWNQKSREIFNFVRAICSPGPNARTFLNKKEMKIFKVDFIKDAPSYKSKIGVIIHVDKSNFFVKTKDTFINVTEYEYNGLIKIGDRFEF